MKNIKNKAFTLVELLVVITILAIISVVAYQNFWWAVDKAVSWRKISDVTTIESSLQQYKAVKNYYPKVWEYSEEDNVWGYNTITANPSNSIETTYINWSEEIETVTWNWWGRVYGVDGTSEGTPDWTNKQVGAKGTISQATLGKKYLTKDLYDPELWDVKVWAGKMIDNWIGRYVYAVFKKPLSADANDWTTNKPWTYFNIAYTVKVDWWDKYITKIVWDYDSESCFDEKYSCPETLIWSSGNVLVDKEENSNSDTRAPNQGIPYPVDWY